MDVAGMIAAAVSTVVSTAALLTPQTEPAASASSAYQINARHDGRLVDPSIKVKELRKKERDKRQERWSRDLGGAVSYPVVAGKRVFVTVVSPGGRGTTLYALNAASGLTIWSTDLGGTYPWSALTYGGGRVYAQNTDGVLTALDPATGLRIWTSQMPGQYSFSSPPTYAAGLVYTGGAGSGGTLYAVDAAKGKVRWTAGVANGDSSSPAVTHDGVYVSYACEQVYAFSPKLGEPIWHHSTGCSGGGGRTPVVSEGKVWVRDDAAMGPAVLDAKTGELRGTFGATTAPAFDGGRSYVVDGGVLQERDAKLLVNGWKFTGDGQLSSAPIVVNGYVFVGSLSGKIWALDGLTGRTVWTGDAGAPITAPDEHNVSAPVTGLAAGAGLVFVPATNRLVAFGK